MTYLKTTRSERLNSPSRAGAARLSRRLRLVALTRNRSRPRTARRIADAVLAAAGVAVLQPSGASSRLRRRRRRDREERADSGLPRTRLTGKPSRKCRTVEMRRIWKLKLIRSCLSAGGVRSKLASTLAVLSGVFRFLPFTRVTRVTTEFAFLHLTLCLTSLLQPYWSADLTEALQNTPTFLAASACSARISSIYGPAG